MQQYRSGVRGVRLLFRLAARGLIRIPQPGESSLRSEDKWASPLRPSYAGVSRSSSKYGANSSREELEQGNTRIREEFERGNANIRGELVVIHEELERGNARIREQLERSNAIAYARSARASVKEPTRSSLLAASRFAS